MNLHCDLDLENNNVIFTQNTPAYDNVPSKFGCQMSHQCDPELEDGKPIFLHNILAQDTASLYWVWLQKVQQQRKYYSDEHSLKFWTLSVTLTLTTTEQSNLFIWQSTLWWCAIKPRLLAKESAVHIIY